MRKITLGLVCCVVAVWAPSARCDKGQWDLRVAGGAAVPLWQTGDYLQGSWQAGGGVGCYLSKSVMMGVEVYYHRHDVQDGWIWLYRELEASTVLQTSLRLKYDFSPGPKSFYVKAGPDVLIFLDEFGAGFDSPGFVNYTETSEWISFGGGVGFQIQSSGPIGGFIETEMNLWSQLDEGASAMFNVRAGLRILLGKPS